MSGSCGTCSFWEREFKTIGGEVIAQEDGKCPMMPTAITIALTSDQAKVVGVYTNERFGCAFYDKMGY